MDISLLLAYDIMARVYTRAIAVFLVDYVPFVKIL